MTDKEKKYLSDILQSIHHILSFIEGVQSFEQYKKDFLVKGAVERHLGIVGEALNKFRKESPSKTFENAQQIISLRNRLIHSYDNVDDRIIWNIVRKYLVPFQKEVEEKIK